MSEKAPFMVFSLSLIHIFNDECKQERGNKEKILIEQRSSLPRSNIHPISRFLRYRGNHGV